MAKTEYSDTEIELIKKASYYEGYAQGVKDALTKEKQSIQTDDPGIRPYVPPRETTGQPPQRMETVVTMYGVRVPELDRLPPPYIIEKWFREIGGDDGKS